MIINKLKIITVKLINKLNLLNLLRNLNMRENLEIFLLI